MSTPDGSGARLIGCIEHINQDWWCCRYSTNVFRRPKQITFTVTAAAGSGSGHLQADDVTRCTWIPPYPVTSGLMDNIDPGLIYHQCVSSSGWNAGLICLGKPHSLPIQTWSCPLSSIFRNDLWKSHCVPSWQNNYTGHPTSLLDVPGTTYAKAGQD